MGFLEIHSYRADPPAFERKTCPRVNSWVKAEAPVERPRMIKN